MPPTASLAYLTPDFPGTGGVIKQRPEDFLVEEQPAYEPSGEGEHLYLFVQKTGATTLDVARRIAKAFNVRKSDVGYAGLKDKHAVTRQLFSVRPPKPDKADDAVQSLKHHPRMEVLWTDRHRNKLRRGHLKGNRFVIRIREVTPTSVLAAKKTLDRLAASGIPNFIGEQRFGYRGNGHILGRHLLRGEYGEFVAELLGHPHDTDSPPLKEAREAFDAGDIERAMELWPRKLRAERQVLDLLRQGKTPEQAVRGMDRSQRELLVTAVQSAAFNRVLDARLRAGTFDRLIPGDLAFKHDSGAVFAVDEATAEVENGPEGRVAKLEVSPSGPMWGIDMPRAEDEVGRLEREALEELGLSEEHLPAAAQFRAPGKRRPLRVALSDPDISGGVDEHGAYIRVAFSLPRGSFATIALREIMKADTGPDLSDETSA